jgi:hypothetical protein
MRRHSRWVEWNGPRGYGLVVTRGGDRRFFLHVVHWLVGACVGSGKATFSSTKCGVARAEKWQKHLRHTPAKPAFIAIR